jgi:hypothetical protein
LILHMSVIALHLIFMGYGHWLPNDPRGSGSQEVRKEALEPLGPVHHGRKIVQPARAELRAFYAEASRRLEYDTLWFDAAMRGVLGAGFGTAVRKCGYTCWSCAIMRNHAHLCIRRHRDTDTVIWNHLATITRMAILERFPQISREHPIWADRPYAVFLETPDDIRRVIGYIEGNPWKDGLPAQRWEWVKPYDGWPLHKFAPRKGKPV